MSHAIKTELNSHQVLTISITGEFSFELISQFRQAYEEYGHAVRQYDINLQLCTGMTSAGLGMLIQMKCWVNNSSVAIRIFNCNDTIAKVFEIAKFDQKFLIESK